MSVTTARLGFLPAPTAGHARPAGLRGAGCLSLRHKRLRRVATAEAPPPWTAPPPHETLPSQADTPPSSWEEKRRKQAENNWVVGLRWKIIFVISFLFFAYLDYMKGRYYNVQVQLAGIFVVLICPTSL